MGPKTSSRFPWKTLLILGDKQELGNFQTTFVKTSQFFGKVSENGRKTSVKLRAKSILQLLWARVPVFPYQSSRFLIWLIITSTTLPPHGHSKDYCFIFIHLAGLSPLETEISRQSYAGLLWSKQFYHYIIQDWLNGDPEMPAPPKDRLNGRNSEAEWQQLFNRDIVSMPDKWEYPWVSWANW